MPFNLVVCIKSVIIRPLKEGAAIRIPRTPESCRLNPFDLPALEIALQIKETHGAHVTALCMGPESAAPAVLEALARGADRGVLVCDPRLAGSDTLVTSTVLARAIAKSGPADLLLFGTRSADSDTGHVGPQTGIILGFPMICRVHFLELRAGNTLCLSRRLDGFLETYSVRLPAALTIDPAAATPRDVSLAALERAFSREDITRLNLEDLALSPEEAGENGSPTRVVSLQEVVKTKACEHITGSTEEQAAALLDRLSKSGLIN